MEGIRKLVSGRLRAQVIGPHPNADLLAAFAERAVSDSERAQILTHVAECGDCRHVLFLALPDAAEAQKVLSIKSRRSPQLALRWWTLAAAIAVCAVLLVGTRHRDVVSLYKQAPAKAPAAPPVAAELKTPPELDEIHALRDDRANNKAAVPRQNAEKVIPTPKHMTAKPAGKFDFDQTGQVRLAPRSETEDVAKLQAQSRNFTALGKLEPGATAPSPAMPAASAQVTGGPARNENVIAGGTGSSGVQVAAQQSSATSNLTGTVFDPSGAVVANAAVTMDGPTGTKTARSDAQGKFSFDSVPPGAYSVKATASGFKTAELQNVAVLSNKDSNLRVTLEPGSVAEAVEVSAAATQSAANKSAASGFEVTSATVAQDAKQSNQLSRKKSGFADQGAAVGGLVSGLSPRWTLSASGALERSLDSGKTWQNVVVGNSAFRALCSIGSHVWVGGKAGVLYHSADAGHNWTQVTASAAGGRKLNADVTRIDFPDPLNGTVSTANGETWTTSDGGQSWNIR